MECANSKELKWEQPWCTKLCDRQKRQTAVSLVNQVHVGCARSGISTTLVEQKCGPHSVADISTLSRCGKSQTSKRRWLRNYEGESRRKMRFEGDRGPNTEACRFVGFR